MRKENIRKITDFGKYEENPFLTKRSIEEIKGHFRKRATRNTRSGRDSITSYVNPGMGETIATSFIREYMVDEEAFFKLYLDKPARFFSLSQAAIRVFAYISTRLKKDEDFVLFNRKECLKYTGYKTDKPVYSGLAELCHAGIIARGYTDAVWFINPQVMFNGDRVAFVNAYVAKNKEKGECQRESQRSDRKGKKEWAHERSMSPGNGAGCAGRRNNGEEEKRRGTYRGSSPAT